jgi:hypothetical protein
MITLAREFDPHKDKLPYVPLLLSAHRTCVNPLKLTDYRHCGYTNIGGSKLPNFWLPADLIKFSSYFVQNNKMCLPNIFFFLF